ncbi:hypothetical protein ACFQVC_32860 [Streptomyces monticola]|uniref:Uncharacterized protein n=1 Tax=Streptomyces monticola TaxID=2666263 RepID=A0ABW2JS41_9ACTN
MSAQPSQRVGRYYTAARRHPWVLGKIGDVRLWLGPYNATQIAVAVLGALVLINTVALWSALGPIPLAGWALAVWTVRRPKIAGRSPLALVTGWLMLLGKPEGGRIGGRPARDKAARALVGGFVIEDLPQMRAAAPASAHLRRTRKPNAAPSPGTPVKRKQPCGRRMSKARTAAPDPAVALSSVQLLLARSAAVEEGRRS